MDSERGWGVVGVTEPERARNSSLDGKGEEGVVSKLWRREGGVCGQRLAE